MAALCWTVASLLWRRLPTSLSAAQLNLLKTGLAMLLQLPLALLVPGLPPLLPALLLAASGVIGITVGDSLFLAALRRLGTRRTLTLDAGGPAFTTLAGMTLLGETPGALQLVGVALISLAVLLVALRSADAPGSQAMVAHPDGAAPRLGLLLALGALACGSLGALLARAALLDGAVHPLQAAWLRLTAASLALLPWLPGLPAPGRRPRLPIRRWPLLLLATLLGTSAGISLQQTALAGLPGGLAVALLSTAPVMALPLAWWLEADRPGWRGVLAALSALAGVALVVLSRASGAPGG
jgi:DME family drug/metabolite transporter